MKKDGIGVLQHRRISEVKYTITVEKLTLFLTNESWNWGVYDPM